MSIGFSLQKSAELDQGSVMATRFIHMKNDTSKMHPPALLSQLHHLRRRILNVKSQPHPLLSPQEGSVLGSQVWDVDCGENRQR